MECTNVVTSPYNDLIAFCTPNKLNLEPILDTKTLFPESKYLEQNADLIRQEIEHYLANYSARSAHQTSSTTFGNSFADDGWRLVLLKFYNKEYKKIQSHFPETMRILRMCGARVKLAMFSILKAHSQIKSHVGPFRGCMRYHLALKVPQDTAKCFIQVEKYTYHWKSGESFLFDDTYVHQVVNNTNEDRIVLFLDIQRSGPDILSPIMDWINDKVCNSFVIHTLSELNNQNEIAIPLHNNNQCGSS